jgi:hypothetical protein
MRRDSDRSIEKALRHSSAGLWRQLFDAARGYLSESEHGSWAGGQQIDTMFIDGEERPVFQMPYVAYSDNVGRIVSLLTEVGAVFPFDWQSWDSVERYRGPTALRTAPVADAARMATVVIRSDRFCEGTIDAAIEDGTFGAILERLLRWYDSERDESG